MTLSVSVASIAALLFAGPVVVVTDDLEDAFRSLKEAESQKDPALLKQMAAKTCSLARAVAVTPVPTSDSDKETYTQLIERARSIELYTEYALYTAAIQGQPATTVDLISALEKQNPKSKYLDEGYTRYFVALHQTGGSAKIPAIAEAAIKNFPEHEDLLMVLADTALQKQQKDRALGFADRLLAALDKHPKPEGMSAADWDKKRNQEAGRAHWIAGIMRAEKSDYVPANKHLRLALPVVKDDKAMLAPTLFYLGLVNYQLGTMTQNKRQVLEAIDFSQQASAIESPYALQAWRNVDAMKRYAHQMR